MTSSLSLHIQCPLCLSDLVDPVILLCEHSYCHKCITCHVNASVGLSRCPECRQPFSLADVKRSRLLRNLAESVKKARAILRVPVECPNGDAICVEHDEKMKLFCVTDQKLACTICREQDKHQGHTLKPVKEASEKSKGEVKEVLQFVCKENQDLEHLIMYQKTEISKCEKRAAGLKTQISSQFEAMHQFLRESEKKLQKELEEKRKKSVAAMQRNLAYIQGKAEDGSKMEKILQSALEIPRPDHFLQWWQDNGFYVTEGMKEKQDGQTKFISIVSNLACTPDSMSMGPYESHLAYFVWKEMLQTIKPGPERVSIKDPGDSYLKVSPEGHSIRQADRSGITYKSYNPSSSTIQTFQSGRHYCEVEVGGKPEWSIGVKAEMAKGSSRQLPEEKIQLNFKNGFFSLTSDYFSCAKFGEQTKDPPRRIGLYLDCERKQVSFYNADTMSLILPYFCSFRQPCSITVCPGLYLFGKNSDPLTFYWR